MNVAKGLLKNVGQEENQEAKIKRAARNLAQAYALTHCSVHSVHNFDSFDCIGDLSNDDLNYIEDEFNKEFSGEFYGRLLIQRGGFIMHKGFFNYSSEAVYVPFCFMGVPIMVSDYE